MATIPTTTVAVRERVAIFALAWTKSRAVAKSSGLGKEYVLTKKLCLLIGRKLAFSGLKHKKLVDTFVEMLGYFECDGQGRYSLIGGN
nr:hypothetical protein [Desulfovirgula thermocuniculi]